VLRGVAFLAGRRRLAYGAAVNVLWAIVVLLGLGYTTSMDATGKKFALREIMAKVNALAEIAWPDTTPEAGLHAIMDIQTAAEKALGLPALDLTTGDPRIT
jgi:hypothetical protein